MLFYSLTVLALCVAFAYVAYVANDSVTLLVIAWVVSFLLPAWSFNHGGQAKFTLQMFAGSLALLALLGTGKSSLPKKWLLADFVVIGLSLSSILSDYANGDVALSTSAGSACEWILPYLFGRIAFSSPLALGRFVGAAVWLCVGLCAWSVIESVSRFNPVDSILGHPGSVQAMENLRWGLRRAEGPTNHPIFFGMLLVLLLPWTLEAFRRGSEGTAPKWWKITPVLNGVAVFFTMSRGPQIAFGICLLGTAFLVLPQWRRRIVLGAVLGSVVGLAAYSLLLGVLHAWSNESEDMQLITLKGETYEYSGTNHRFLQLLYYEDAVRNTGWLGYGNARIVSNPPNLPFVDEDYAEQFRSMDNQYLIQVLRCGYLGLGLLLLLGVCTVWELLRPALCIGSPYALISAGCLSAIVAVLVMLTTVWFALDFRFFWLFTAGLAGSLRANFDTPATDTSDMRYQWVPTGQLAFGHPSRLHSV